MDKWFLTLLTVLMIILAICIFIALIKVIKGPTLTNRLVSVNMIGTMVNVMIIMLTIYLQEEWLVDVAMLYTAISFLSVIVLSKVYVGVYKQKEAEK